MTKMRAYSMATVLRPWRASVPSSCVLEHDRLDDVGDVLEGVQRPLHRLDDVLPPQHLQGVELAAEQAGEDATVDSVALALEAVDGVEMGLDAFSWTRGARAVPGSPRRTGRGGRPAPSARVAEPVGALGHVGG